MKYFKECTTINDVKSRYKELAKENHPDRGGDTATMQDINNEYSFACAKILKGENLTSEEIESEILNFEAYRDAVNAIINLPGIIIELVGSWIWVTGATKPVKDTLKGAGFFFAYKKGAWYFRTAEYKVRNRTKMSMDEIRGKYGSQLVSGGKFRKELKN